MSCADACGKLGVKGTDVFLCSCDHAVSDALRSPRHFRIPLKGGDAGELLAWVTLYVDQTNTSFTMETKCVCALLRSISWLDVYLDIYAIKLDHIIIIIKMDNAVLEILSNNALPTACETSYEALFGASFPT